MCHVLHQLGAVFAFSSSSNSVRPAPRLSLRLILKPAVNKASRLPLARTLWPSIQIICPVVFCRLSEKQVVRLGEYCVSSQFPCHKERMSVCASAVILHACLRPLPSCSWHERICSRRIHVLNMRNIFVTALKVTPLTTHSSSSRSHFLNYRNDTSAYGCGLT